MTKFKQLRNMSLEQGAIIHFLKSSNNVKQTIKTTNSYQILL